MTGLWKWLLDDREFTHGGGEKSVPTSDAEIGAAELNWGSSTGEDKMLRLSNWATLCGALLALLSSRANAATVTYEFTADITNSTVPGTSSVIAGTFTYDDGVSDTQPDNQTFGGYPQPIGSSINMTSGAFFYGAHLDEVQVFGHVHL